MKWVTQYSIPLFTLKALTGFSFIHSVNTPIKWVNLAIQFKNIILTHNCVFSVYCLFTVYRNILFVCEISKCFCRHQEAKVNIKILFRLQHNNLIYTKKYHSVHVINKEPGKLYKNTLLKNSLYIEFKIQSDEKIYAYLHK